MSTPAFEEAGRDWDAWDQSKDKVFMSYDNKVKHYLKARGLSATGSTPAHALEVVSLAGGGVLATRPPPDASQHASQHATPVQLVSVTALPEAVPVLVAPVPHVANVSSSQHTHGHGVAVEALAGLAGAASEGRQSPVDYLPTTNALVKIVPCKVSRQSARHVN